MPESLVGKPRRAWVVFLLTFLLQPIFWPLYLLLTFRSLDKQHGRDHPIGWWVPSIVPSLGLLLAIPYAWMELWRLHRSRRARGLRKGIGPFAFIVITLVGPLAALGYYAYIQATGNGAHAFDAADLTSMLAPATWQLVVIQALWALTPALALALVTASANRLWRHIYDEKGEAWPWRGPSETAPSA